MLLVLTCFSLLPTKLAKKHEFLCLEDALLAL